MYKSSVILRIPGTEYQFKLYEEHIEQIIKEHYKLNYIALDQMWGNYYRSNRIHKKNKINEIEGNIIDRLYEIIQIEYDKIENNKKSRKLYITKILNRLYKTYKYGKFNKIKQELKRMGFSLKNEKYTTAYIIISRNDKNE